jgi:hypothetical protein
MRLKHARLKADRAFEHLEELTRELDRFRQDEPIKVSTYKRPEIGRRFIRVDTKDISDRSYLLVGDFAHNLRCVLDHIVWQLVAAATQAVPTRQVQWPVLAAPDPSTLNRHTKGAAVPAVAVIESFQPYHAGPDPAYKQHPLWQVHKLDIVDKHRRVVINESIVEAYFPTLSKRSDFNHESGDHYFEIGFPIDAPLVPMHYHPVPVIRFGAAEEDLYVTPDRLKELYEYVKGEVLPKFEPFLS